MPCCLWKPSSWWMRVSRSSRSGSSSDSTMMRGSLTSPSSVYRKAPRVSIHVVGTQSSQLGLLRCRQGTSNNARDTARDRPVRPSPTRQVAKRDRDNRCHWGIPKTYGDVGRGAEARAAVKPVIIAELVDLDPLPIDHLMRHGLCHHRGVVLPLAVSGGEAAVENVVVLVEGQKVGIDKGNRRQLFGCRWDNARTRFSVAARVKTSGRALLERERKGMVGGAKRGRSLDGIRWTESDGCDRESWRGCVAGLRSVVYRCRANVGGTSEKEKGAKRMDAVGDVTSGGEEGEVVKG